MHRWTTRSHDGDDSIVAQTLPWQAQHQSIQLLRAELLMPVNARRRPDKPALVEAACCQPDANAIVHEHLDAIGPAVGKQICMVRMRCTEYLDHTAQCRIRARTHVQWLHCQPGAVDADHFRTVADQ